MDPMDPRGKHGVWPPPPIQCVEQWREGRDSTAKNPKDPRFEKRGKSPKTKPGKERSSWSSIEIRHAVVGYEVRWKTTRKVLEGRRPHCRSSTAAIAIRRSRAHSCGSHLWRHPWNTSSRTWFRRSIKETSNSWETFMRASNRLRENFQILENLPFFFFFLFLIRIWTIGCRFRNQDFWDIINSNRFWYLFI